MILTRASISSTLAVPDHNLMRRVNRWRAPRWFRWWMLLATRAGDGWLWGLVGIAVLLQSDALRFRAIESAACAVAVGIVVFHKVKRVFCRTRPRDIEPHCWCYIATKDKFSFPSGHSTTAFAVGFVVRFVLSRSYAVAAGAGRQRSGIASGCRDAFFERRTGGIGHGRPPRLRRFPVRRLNGRQAHVLGS